MTPLPHKAGRGSMAEVSDAKTLRRSVFASGVPQSKEYGAGGYAARHGRLCDGDRDESESDRRMGFDAPASGRYPQFHARQRERTTE